MSLVTVPRTSDSSPIIAVSCAVVAVVFPLAIDSLAAVINTGCRSLVVTVNSLCER